jgi:hypothetical protein
VQYLQKGLARKIDLDLFFEIGRKYFSLIVKLLGTIAVDEKANSQWQVGG